MKPMSAVAVVLAVLWLPVAAQDTQEPGEPSAAAEPQTPPAADESRRAGAGDDVFIPSEELGADEEATFPVDI